jgi:signal transduction histidine kinase
MAGGNEYRDSAQLNALVRRQLPLVAQRLAQTLDRLQRPLVEAETYVPAGQWWEAIARQYQGEGVEFLPAKLAPETRVPRSLFDSVADNLMRNALGKRAAEPGIRVRASLEQSGAELVLRVCDTGSAVSGELAAGLLRAPVASSGGLGIGLYQAARQAEALGYRLALLANEDGEVCFVLSGPAT